MPKPALQTGAPIAKVEATKSPSPTKPVPAEPTAPLPVQASAPVPPDSPQTATAPTGPSAAQRRRYERRQRFLQSPEFAQIATALTTRWPHLFRVTPETIRPLAIGIADDLCAQLPDCSPKLVHHTLSQWMADHRVIYWKALMQGGPRYDLDGNPNGEVTPEQQADAREKRKAWYARREEIRQQHAETEQDASATSGQEGTD
jgi:ProP effector